MDRSGLMPQCGRLKFEATANAEPKNAASAVPDFLFQAKDNGAVATIPVGQRFQIQVEENPTTGYKWSEPEFDKQCLLLESDQYTPYKEAGIGGGGIRLFAFTVKSECKTTVRLMYKRPWETNVAPEATFEITVSGSH
jgi:inhibitor of cysteine peptidase